MLVYHEGSDENIGEFVMNFRDDDGDVNGITYIRSFRMIYDSIPEVW